MGRKAVVATAAALVVCPIVFLLGYKHWLNTRTFNPLDIPVSLSQGHFKTPEFYINLEGSYYANISVDYPATYTFGCQSTAWESLRAHFIAYQNGVPVAETAPPRYPGSDSLYFERTGFLYLEKKGYYALDVKILSDAACLDSAHPRLRVWTWNSYYQDRYETALWAIPVAAIAGLALLGYVVVFLAPKAKPHRIARNEEERAPAGLPVYRPRSVKLISTFLPHFPVLLATLLALLVFILAILQAPYPSKGLYVSLNAKTSEADNLNSAMPPIVVRLQDAGPGLAPKLYVSSVPVDWDHLEEAVKAQLKLRPQWTVYVDGDSEVPWQNVAQVADIARGLHAKVVLLTPETKKLVEPKVTREKSARR